MSESWGWIGFGVIVVALMALDLGILNRKAHTPSLREAAIWTAVWVSASALFAVGVFLFHPRGVHAGMEYVAGYLIEESLSVDNIFVFAVVFSYFAVPLHYQRRVLFWGILSAIIMRGVFIFAGIKLIELFHPIIYVFGAFLLFTAYKLAHSQHESIDLEHNRVIRLARRYLPITHRFDGQRFLTRENGRLVGTPLLLVLLVIETTDVMFALDSIPAILAITRDPLIVYTSNIFAILGLRSLYFLLAGVMDLFVYLRYGLSVVLGFVGLKMLLNSWLEHVPRNLLLGVSLGFIALVITASIVASLVWPPKEHQELLGPPDADPGAHPADEAAAGEMAQKVE